MARLFWICCGGAFGTGARYLLSLWIPRVTGGDFPWATLAINALGSLLLGFLLQAPPAVADMLSPTLRLALATGVLGGFTTYSTFNYETLRLLQKDPWLGLANLGATVVLCLLAGALGILLARVLTGS